MHAYSKLVRPLPWQLDSACIGTTQYGSVKNFIHALASISSFYCLTCPCCNAQGVAIMILESPYHGARQTSGQKLYMGHIQSIQVHFIGVSKV